MRCTYGIARYPRRPEEPLLATILSQHRPFTAVWIRLTASYEYGGVFVTDLSIVIVNWNVVGLLRRCLSSIVGELRPEPGLDLVLPGTSWSYEIWVVDNASTDGSAEMVREEFPYVHLIANSENLGFTVANNQAIG